MTKTEYHLFGFVSLCINKHLELLDYIVVADVLFTTVTEDKPGHLYQVTGLGLQALPPSTYTSCRHLPSLLKHRCIFSYLPHDS